MEKKTVEILIVTRSVALQRGLGALLESLPEITRVKAVKDLSNAYAWIESHAPRIVLLDTLLLGSDHRSMLTKIKTLVPDAQRVLLVNDVQEVNLIPQHAEAILIKGASPSAVSTIITNLLSGKGDDHEHSDTNQ